MALFQYQRDDGREPLNEWLGSMSDKIAQARVRIRLRRLEAGNFGDCEPVGESVIELRVTLAPATVLIVAATVKLLSCCCAGRQEKPAMRQQAG